MSYKRVVKKKGKSYGPYIYESYRDESGKVKKRYLGKLEDKKVSLSLFFLVGFLVFGLVVGSGYTTDILFNEGEVSGSIINSIKDSFSSVKDGFTGLVVGDEPKEKVKEEAPKEKIVDEPKKEAKEKSKEKSKDEIIEIAGESEVEVAVESIQEVEEPVEGSSGESDADESVSSVEEVIGDEDEIIIDENETEEIIPEVNETLTNETIEDETNETLVKEVNESVVEEVNETLVEEVNESVVEDVVDGGISEINETLVNETVLNETLINETLINETLINETLINETLINETLVNETVLNETLVNISQVNVSTLQYRAVINRPVKWLKKIDISDGENLTIELPKDAENISVLTNEEVGEAFDSIGDYGEVVDDADREEVVSGGLLTGNVALDIREGQGLLTRFWNWLIGFTISGNVILEESISDEITDTENSTIVKLENIISDESEVGIEYYTEAPLANETNLSNGKRVVVSAPDELNYTDILAYAMVDGLRAGMNDSRLKLYWYASREDAVRYGYVEQNSSVSFGTPLQVPSEEGTLPQVPSEEGTLPQVPSEEGNESVEDAIPENVSEVVENVSIELNESVDVDESVGNITVDNVTEIVDINDSSDNASEEIINTGILTGNVISELGVNSSENMTEENMTIENASEDFVRVEVSYVAYDFDNDSYVDYVEWIVPHLSEQVYDIIYITKADHLDSNYTFIEDVYNDVSSLDGNYSLIEDGHYLRVTFERNLTNAKDITIYARAGCDGSILINGVDVPCEIYWKKMRLDGLRREFDNG